MFAALLEQWGSIGWTVRWNMCAVPKQTALAAKEYFEEHPPGRIHCSTHQDDLPGGIHGPSMGIRNHLLHLAQAVRPSD
jgi:hypothetical protein